MLFQGFTYTAPDLEAAQVAAHQMLGGGSRSPTGAVMPTSVSPSSTTCFQSPPVVHAPTPSTAVSSSMHDSNHQPPHPSISPPPPAMGIGPVVGVSPNQPPLASELGSPHGVVGAPFGASPSSPSDRPFLPPWGISSPPDASLSDGCLGSTRRGGGNEWEDVDPALRLG